MDWNKAKTILIIALLVTNLALGGVLLSRQEARRLAAETAAESTRVYLEELGVDVQCAIPTVQESCPVLFVSLTQPGSGDSEYGGMPIVVSGARMEAKALKAGDTKALTISASQALQSLVNTRLGQEASGLQIRSLELVYRVDRSDFGTQAGEDTAVPAWRILTDRGEFFIEAFL